MIQIKDPKLYDIERFKISTVSEVVGMELRIFDIDIKERSHKRSAVVKAMDLNTAVLHIFEVTTPALYVNLKYLKKINKMPLWYMIVRDNGIFINIDYSEAVKRKLA